MTSEINRCYRMLELEPGASLEQVKQAWRELVKVWHPDRFPNDAKLQHKAQERLKEINLSYERLQEFLISGISGTFPTRGEPSPGGTAKASESTPPPNSSANTTAKNKPSRARWLLVLPAACVGYAIVMLLAVLASQEPIVGYHDENGREIQVIQATFGSIIAAIAFVLTGTKTAPKHKIETAVSLAVLFCTTLAVLFTIRVMQGMDDFFVGWAGFCGIISIASAVGASISVYRNEIQERRIAEIRSNQFASEGKTKM